MVFIYLGVLNLFLFLLMGIDKFKAQHGLWRIPEKVLLGLGLIGGGIGGFLGGQIFRHKTRKWYFQFAWIIGILVLVALIIFIK